MSTPEERPQQIIIQQPQGCLSSAMGVAGGILIALLILGVLFFGGCLFFLNAVGNRSSP